MKQEEMDTLRKKIKDSAQDVPMPEGLEPEQMMKKLKNSADHGRRTWRRPVQYGVLAAAALITVFAVDRIQTGKLEVRTEVIADPQHGGEAVLETAAPEELTEEALRYTAESYNDIYREIKAYRRSPWEGFFTEEKGVESVMIEETAAATEGAAPEAMAPESAGPGAAAPEMDKAEASLTSGSGSYSETNVQVEGVDEGDIVKTDGQYLYIMSKDHGHIQIVEANGSSPKKRGIVEDTSTTRGTRTIQEFYINGDKLSVIRQAYEDDLSRDAAVTHKSITYLETYDISDRDDPKLLGTVSQDGFYRSSRRVNDLVYLFTNYTPRDIRGVRNIRSYIPSVNEKALTSDSIYLPEHISGPDYVVISSVHMGSPDKTVSQKAVLASGELFYVSPSNIYIGSTMYDDRARQYNYTELMKLSYDSGKIGFKAHANVDGYLNNQFSMDEYNGKLRVVSTLNYSGGSSTNSLFVLDENLKRIGEIKDLAPGEQIYSARFMGDIGYFVTFRNMDPLFSADLSDPENPKILGELKITGFSEYLHPFDENLLLGIGQEVNPDTGNFEGLKLSMFDTSDPRDVKEVMKTVEESYEYSPAWNNHKTVMVSAGKNIIGFAVENLDNETRTWDSRYVIYSYDQEQGFVEEMIYSFDTWDIGLTRGIYINSWFYVVEPGRVTVFSLENFEQAGQLKY